MLRVPRTMALWVNFPLLATVLVAQEGAQVFDLSPFEVSSRQGGYYATNSLSAYRVNTPVKDLPFNMEIFTGEFLEDIKASDLADALYWAPGVNQFNSGGKTDYNAGGGDGFSIRGLESSRPKRNGFTRYYILDSTNIAQVEVVKGPVSALFGTSQPGGVINYITKKPMPEFSGSVQVNVGSWDYRRAQLEVTGPLVDSKTVLYRLDASWMDRGGYRDFDEETRKFVAPVLEIRPFKDWMIRADFEYSKADSNPVSALPIWNPEAYAEWVADGSPEGRFRYQSYGLPYDDDLGLTLYTDIADERLPLTTNPAGPDSFIVSESDALTVEATGKLTEWLDLRGVISEATTTRDIYLSFPNRLRLMGDGLQRNSGVSQYLDNTNQLHQVDLVSHFDLFAISHRIIAGTDYAREQYTLYQFNGAPYYLFLREDSLPFVNSDNSANLDKRYRDYSLDPRRPFPANPFIENNSKIRAYYASYQASALAGRVRLLAGLRRDAYDDLEQPQVPTMKVRSPQVGVNLEVIPGLTFYANYSESFVPAGGSMLVINEDETDVVSAPVPPQLGAGYEFGFKWQLPDNRIGGTLAFFDIERSNVLRKGTFIPETGPRAGEQLSYNRLISGQTSTGVEADISWNPRDNIQIKLGYTYIDGEEVDQDLLPTPFDDYLRTIYGVPEHDVALIGSYSFSEGRLAGLKVVLSANYKSRRSGNLSVSSNSRTQQLTDINYIWLDAYTRIDLLLSYKTQIGKYDTEYSLRLENVLDETYFLPGPHLGNPFNLKAGIKLTF